MKLTDKRILVTGADGFIGSHLTETLLDMGCRVRAVIPTIITQIAAGKKQIQLGDVSPTRDFNYVLDTCKGFIDLVRSDKTIGEVVNIRSVPPVLRQHQNPHPDRIHTSIFPGTGIERMH